MYAREIDTALLRLTLLRQEEWSDFGLAALSASLSLLATQVEPGFAWPLLIGGFVMAARGARALILRDELVERLAAERAAYAIAEIRKRAMRETAMDRRRYFAACIRSALRDEHAPDRALATDELEELTLELEDETLALEPASAVSCARLVSDPGDLSFASPPEELRSRARQIRSGFHPRSDAPPPGSSASTACVATPRRADPR